MTVAPEQPSQVPKAAVPAATAGPELAADLPMAVLPPEDAAPAGDEKWPTRATFAGRMKLGSAEAKQCFEERRNKYYSSVPRAFWKDHHEREYWKLCTAAHPDLDAAVAKFLQNKAPAQQALPKVGRGRGRGRGRCGLGRGKAATRH